MANRRLIGPIAICLALSGLLADYVFWGDSRWSVAAFLGKAASVFGTVFGPALNPTAYGWLGHFAVPAIMILLAVGLLWLTVARAKGAMSKATVSVEEVGLSFPRPSPVLPPTAADEIASPTLANPAKQFGIAWKLSLSFGVLAVTMGFAASIIAYTYLAVAMEEQVKRRTEILVSGISEVAKNYHTDKGESDLRRVIDNQLADRSVAYVYVEDSEGSILAHTPRELPRFLRRDFPTSAIRAINGVDTEYRGSPVYEIAVRVGKLDGGFAHLGIWRNTVQQETYGIFIPIVASIFAIVCLTTIAFAWLAAYLTLPLTRLAHYANQLSNGELNLELRAEEESDEVGDLTHSFARMRSSLCAVLVRLGEMPPTHQSNDSLR